ncbi:MAG: acyltransferase family protein [Pirellula sp.]
MNPHPIASTKNYWQGQRLAIADLMRGLAAVCIVWHHLSLYAPQSDLADRFAPNVGYALYNYLHYAVAIFFVLGGLTASIDKRSRALGETLQDILKRYLRLAIPYLVMLSLLLVINFTATHYDWSLHQIESFSWPQLATHSVFLQDIFGYGNFSAGTWYLCIELQWSCFVLLLGYVANRWETIKFDSVRIQVAILFPLGVASAWLWSQSESFEPYFLFFASQYVLGFFLGLSLQGKLPSLALLLYSMAIASSLAINPRPQLLTSLLAAGFLLYLVPRVQDWKLPLLFRWLGDISYSLFLVHYLVDGLVLKLIDPWAKQSPSWAAGAMAIAFACSLGVADLFHRFVERPAIRWIKR